MMINKRKGLTAALIAFIMAVSPLGMVNSNAETNIIHETSAKETITQGVTHENITRFTTNGWLNINILRVDLSNQYIKVDTLSNSESIGKLASTKTMATQSGAIAAINASFFTPVGGSRGDVVGPIVKSGDLLCESGDYNTYSDSMGSFSLTKLNEVLFNYWQTDITLIAPNGSTTDIARYNKSDSDYTDFSIFDKKWGAMSIGASQAMPDIVEMVVDGGKVSQILVSQPAVQIPQNGYVVVTRGTGGKFLLDNFTVGDSAGMSIVTNPDWKNLNMSVSGGSILVKDGKIPAKFSFDTAYIAQKQPRTVIASSKDGKQLILVTVDGRQGRSIGMTQQEIAQFMLGIGAYNALNLDGGGSTAMVGRSPGNTSLGVMNSPSDGLVRSVSTAIGVFSIAPPSSLAGMIINTDDDNIFVNTSRAFTVKGYDRYFNPVSVKPEDIKWSVSGIKGSFKGNVFYPKSIGEGKIIAKVGSVSVSSPISVLSAPAQLILSSSSLKLPLNQTKDFTVTGINKTGYSAVIDPADVKWTVKGSMGKFSGSKFTATTRGAGYIDASVGSTHAYCTVSVAADTSTVKDKFEASNGSFLSSRDTVTGTYEISTEQKHTGNASGKLTYDFTDTEGTRAAYFVLGNNGMSLDAGSSKLGLWVYNDHENSNWMRAEIIDANGKKQTPDFTKNMDWTGWKYVETSLDSISLPAKLTRLYTVQISPVAETGSIYLDDLAVITSGYPPVDLTKLPKDTVPVDDAKVVTSFTKATADSFRFAVFGHSHEPANPLQKLLLTKFTQKVDNYIDAAVIVGDGSHDAVAKMIKKKKTIAANTVDIAATKEADYKYGYTDIKNSRFFKMDIRKDSLRISDTFQWQQFLKDLDSFKGSNAFIFLENSPEKFSDDLELSLFKETLENYRVKTHKNVWLFFKGEKNENHMENGIRYISTAGYDVTGLTPGNTDIATYVLVTVRGNNVTYAFKPLT